MFFLSRLEATNHPFPSSCTVGLVWFCWKRAVFSHTCLVFSPASPWPLGHLFLLGWFTNFTHFNPKNEGLEDVFLLQKWKFSGSMLVIGGLRVYESSKRKPSIFQMVATPSREQLSRPFPERMAVENPKN